MTIRAYIGPQGLPEINSTGLYHNFWIRCEGLEDLGDGFTVAFGATKEDIDAAMKVAAKNVLDPYLQDPIAVTEIERI